MKSVYYLLFLLGTLLPMTASRHVQFFRKDYIYNDEFDAYYKLHWDLNGLSWNTAFLACNDEGATLFYPNMKDEWTLVKNLTRGLAEPPNVTNILIGLHDEFGLGEFITVDGSSTSSPLFAEKPEDMSAMSTSPRCVLMNIETGLYTVTSCIDTYEPLPFICKKIDDEFCPTIDPGYKYIKSSKKCYKINNRLKTWDEAMRTCYMEGGILAVLENKEQAEAIIDNLERGGMYYVGVRKMFSLRTYYTVKGQRFENVYQRNSRYSTNDLDCGAIYVDDVISTTTKDCGESLAFICEMKVN